MTGQQIRWEAERVLALAPDAASRKAGEGLAAADRWSDTGWRGDTLWG
ncbi:SWIM zinc finger family protein, partial [Streptomyces durbertensis]|nr:SWIM zinc finger family protein [Streptomyces durbertensis]